jgi:aminoglycoside phosphotransferase (APT) family kinase protein
VCGVSQEVLDPLAILAALGFLGPAQATPVHGGADTALWRVEQAGHTYALRVFRPDQASVCQRESAVMAAARKRGLPVTEVHAKGTWHGRPALLLTWMPGRPLREVVRAAPWRSWALGLAFGRTQATIHRAPVPAELTSDPMSWIAWANPDAALRARLLAVAREPGILLHLDYHPLNVLVAGGRISAILDWANARTGDPRADLARTVSILHFAPHWGSPPAPVQTIARRAFAAGWRRGYREAAGPMTGMAPFYAWAGAVMVRDLTPRLGRSDLPWLTPSLLEHVQQWSDVWKARALT